jgi:hypothetical protein
MGGGSASATTGQAAAFTPPVGETKIGGGYAPAGTTGGPGGLTGAGTGTAITSASGQQFEYVPVGAAVKGVQYFYQPEPGIFTPLPNPNSLPSNTPWYQQVSSSA